LRRYLWQTLCFFRKLMPANQSAPTWKGRLLLEQFAVARNSFLQSQKSRQGLVNDIEKPTLPFHPPTTNTRTRDLPDVVIVSEVPSDGKESDEHEGQLYRFCQHCEGLKHGRDQKAVAVVEILIAIDGITAVGARPCCFASVKIERRNKPDPILKSLKNRKSVSTKLIYFKKWQW